MSDQNRNNNNNVRQGNRPRPTSNGPRIGRIGQWGGVSGSGNAPSNSRSSSGTRFATLRGLSSEGGPRLGGTPHTPDTGSDSNDEQEDSREGQTWFAGGERSGISIQNPNRSGALNGSNADIIMNLLRKAHEAGYAASAAAGPGSRSAFTGAGHTLGSDEVESRVVPDPNAAPSTGHVARRITFWRNGFSIEDGPLLSYTDPANEEILRSIDSGQAPPDLLNVRYGEPVQLLVDKRTHEDYEPPKHQAFEGTGHRLGAPTPPIAGSSTSPPAASAPAAPATSRAEDAESLQTKFEVDQSQPTTSIQLRLADGTRMLCRVNLTHVIRDIRNFINASRPENLTRSYTISTTFPNRVLDDDTQTIEAAKLQNTVIVQRWV